MIHELTIHLVRHGRTAYNAENRFLGSSDPPLDKEGGRQADRAARLLGHRSVAAIHSSPQRRALDTAKRLGESRGLAVSIVPEFREMDLGDLEGISFHELLAKYPDLAASWRRNPAKTCLPGGENLAEVSRRAWSSFQELADEAKSRGKERGDLVIVAHRMVLGTLIANAIGLPLRHCLRLQVDLGSVTTLVHGRQEWRLEVLNRT